MEDTSKVHVFMHFEELFTVGNACDGPVLSCSPPYAAEHGTLYGGSGEGTPKILVVWPTVQLAHLYVIFLTCKNASD